MTAKKKIKVIWGETTSFSNDTIINNNKDSEDSAFVMLL